MAGLLKGLILGFVIVFPGMSGGTLFVIFGIYEQLMYDIARLNIRPYLPFVSGAVLGIYSGGYALSFLFAHYRDLSAAFLLGCLLASLKVLLGDKPAPNGSRLATLFLGAALTFIFASEPLALLKESGNPSALLLFVGGALATAAMIIPGLPGSSVLIMLGIYDNILFSLRELACLNLFFFLSGSILGIFFLARLFDGIFERHRVIISYLFSGLILGSARVVLPLEWNIPVLFPLAAGFVLVWFWGGKLKQQ
ncbi:MAG TPA: DUF368 domain-containing protein [Firmicutes bacterium]|nr:DUF368 domain-containing protein [Bacillota bacterium]